MSPRMPPSSSTVAPLYRDTTICYAYMCGYAYSCAESSIRPAQVMKRRCMRYTPETLRVRPAVSDFALDILAKRRRNGEGLCAETKAILDKLRPDGPLRRLP